MLATSLMRANFCAASAWVSEAASARAAASATHHQMDAREGGAPMISPLSRMIFALRMAFISRIGDLQSDSSGSHHFTDLRASPTPCP